MAVGLNDIVVLADVRTYLNKTSDDTADDTFLQKLITVCSGKIERFLNGPVKVQNYSGELYDGSGRDTLNVRQWPVVSLLTPAVSDVQHQASPKSDWITLESTIEYIMIRPDLPHQIYLYAQIFPYGRNNIKVSYKAGYSVIPADIELVCLEMVADAFKKSNAGGGRLGRGSEAINSGGVSATNSYIDLSKGHKEILSGYRHWQA